MIAERHQGKVVQEVPHLTVANVHQPEREKEREREREIERERERERETVYCIYLNQRVDWQRSI